MRNEERETRNEKQEINFKVPPRFSEASAKQSLGDLVGKKKGSDFFNHKMSRLDHSGTS